MATLRITLKRSLIGNTQRQRDNVRSLGLRKIRQTVEHQDTPVIRGMITKVRHLVEVEEVPS
ncbi:MAG TPA: 50S ribosomal protein L30 [Dehalococcoidia bacterium]|nr:50S ribosomal protein L30 [Dehalococcoidia bacterium]